MQSKFTKDPEQSIALQKSTTLLTELEVAGITGYSVRTLQSHRRSRQGIPFVRLAFNKIRYRLCDVEAHIENHLVVTK
ncbi:MAG: helix-turn-helix domain-containing protein [Candidatus Thiodiazotropha endolucinida]|nr:helix-turn-helix domain-containing protein [Candidatus Thiodiazotropha endolucinida]